MSESWDYEEKSEFAGEDNDFLDIAKTIIAFANGVGGVIVRKGVTCRPALLDSARLDDFVNRWTAPRIRNIVSKREADDCFVVEVPPSEDGPHVISHSASYKLPSGKQRPAFHPGQIYGPAQFKNRARNSRRCPRNGTEGYREGVSCTGRRN